MGKYKKGILGRFRGMIGTVIGSVWNGVQYMKSLPDISPDRKPTQKQLNQQLIFALVKEFLKPLKSLIEVGYQHFTDGISPVNAAMGYHLKHAVKGTTPNYEINFPNVKFSAGDLEEPQLAGIATGGAAKIDFEWGAVLNKDEGAPTDMASFLAYCPALKKYLKIRDAVARSVLTFTMQVPAAWIGHDAHFWMSFTSEDGEKVSNSVYVGLLPIV